jgi:ribosomal protein S9
MMSEEINPEELMRRMDALLAEIEKQKALDGEDSRIMTGLKRTIDEARMDVAEDVAKVKARVDEVTAYVERKFGETNAQVDAVKTGLGGAIKAFKESYRKSLAPKAPTPKQEAKAAPKEEPEVPTGK